MNIEVHRLNGGHIRNGFAITSLSRHICLATLAKGRILSFAKSSRHSQRETAWELAKSFRNFHNARSAPLRCNIYPCYHAPARMISV